MLRRMVFGGVFFTLLSLLPTAAITAQDAEKDAGAKGADKAAEGKDAEAVELSAEEVQRLIEQLESADFRQRQLASRRLSEAGKSAVGPLTRAAQSPERETMGRSLEILERFAKAEDEQLNAAARTALETVARGDNELAARRAKAILEPPKPPRPAEPRPAVGGGIRIGGGGIQIRGGGGIQIGGARGVKIANGRITVGKGAQIITTHINGAARTVKVVKGEGRQILIEDDEKHVKIVVTDAPPGGKPVERTAEAKNADELKQKNAELYEIYKEYDGYRKNGVTIKG